MNNDFNLRNISIKKAYSSDIDNILKDFYIPALANSIHYCRLAGFFSSTSLAIAAKGISGLIKNDGMMKLVISPRLSKEDLKILVEVNSNPENFIEKRMLDELDKFENEFIRDHVYALGWMVANKILEIKVAMPYDNFGSLLSYEEGQQRGIFHQKVGILKDSHDNIITFSGSINESATGWLENIEEFKVFRNWEEHEREYVEADISKFDLFWNNRSKKIKVMNIPEAVEKKLIGIAPTDISNLSLNNWYKKSGSQKKTIVLFKHQEQAIESWIKNGFRCIFEMATGTGKTFTALGCLKKLFSQEAKLITTIVCPYNHLIAQWREALDEFGVTDVKLILCDGTNPKWKMQAFDLVREVNHGALDRLIFFTTPNTFSTKEFIELIQLSKTKTFVIIDEVHGAGAEKRKKGLIEKYDFRLGLSATPSRWLDPEGTRDLFSFFCVKDKEGIFSFSIKDAIKTINPMTGQTYLVPYEYKPYFVELTEDEFYEYEKLTRKIGILFHKTKNNVDKIEKYSLLLEERQKLIRNALNKYKMFESIIDEIGTITHCLVYCSPEQINRVQEILCNKDIIQHKFTMKESTAPDKRYGGISEREYLLKNFTDGYYQALVAMKCLDEGVDIPQARTGIIMASSENPIQYIQRRGRVLRRFPGKEKAIIYDLIVFPPPIDLSEELNQLEKRIIIKELRRYIEFAEVSLNAIECIRILREAGDKYNI
jgi:superfamily II DNA or RNA helicase